jgi:AhpD family alkylhydroperoxidase
MANSPAALGAYLSFAGAFREAKLSAEIRDLIAIVVAEASGCDYTLSAVSALARNNGRRDGDLAGARATVANDSKTGGRLAIS